MEQLKPALTYDQQIEKLKTAHNLLIKDDNTAFDILSKVNYYRLSAYGIGLVKKDDKEKYQDGISLEHIYRLYEFDSLFRNLLTYIIEKIEIQLRTQISNFLALKYGPEGYINPENFLDKKNKDGKLIHSSVMDSFRKECEHQKKVPFVKHHIDKYDGRFPIWVAIELFTFGNLSSLYNIMKKEDQKEIAKLYNTETMYLGSWILALVEIRNICAHYSRLYNMPLKQIPHLYSEYQKYKSDKNCKIFLSLIAIKRMVKSDDRWNSFEVKLEELIEKYKDVVILSYIGFPEEWKSVLSD